MNATCRALHAVMHMQIFPAAVAKKAMVMKHVLNAQRLDADLGEGEEQQATAVRAHMALMGQLLALQRARLDAALQQHLAEAQVTNHCPGCRQVAQGCDPNNMAHDC